MLSLLISHHRKKQNGDGHLLLSDIKCTTLTYTFGEDCIKPCRCCIYKNDFLETKEKPIMKTLPISIIVDETTRVGNGLGGGAKRLGVKNRGKTTRGKQPGGKCLGVETSCYHDIHSLNSGERNKSSLLQLCNVELLIAVTNCYSTEWLNKNIILDLSKTETF